MQYEEIMIYRALNPKIPLGTVLKKFGVQQRQLIYYEEHMNMKRTPRGYLNKLRAKFQDDLDKRSEGTVE